MLEDWISLRKWHFHMGQEHQHSRTQWEEGWCAVMSVCPVQWGILPAPGSPAAPPGIHISKPPSLGSSYWKSFHTVNVPSHSTVCLSDLFKCTCGGERRKMSISIPEWYWGMRRRKADAFIHLMPIQKEELAGSLGVNKPECFYFAISLPLKKI